MSKSVITSKKIKSLLTGASHKKLLYDVMNIVKYNRMFKLLIELAFEPKKMSRGHCCCWRRCLQSSQSQNGCQLR